MDINCSNRKLFLQSLEDFSKIDFHKDEDIFCLEEDLKNNTLYFSVEEKTAGIFTKIARSFVFPICSTQIYYDQNDIEEVFADFLKRNYSIMQSSPYEGLDDKKETMKKLKLIHEKFQDIFSKESPVVEGIKFLGRAALDYNRINRDSILYRAPEITSFAPSEVVTLSRNLKSASEEAVEESKRRPEKIEVDRVSLLTSIVHAINIDQIPLNEFGFTSIEECLEVLHELVDSGYSLEHLDFNGMLNYRAVFSEDRFQLLLDLLDKLPSPSPLKTLNLSNWKISSSIHRLSPYLKKFIHLKTLNLEWNNLVRTRTAGMKALASALENLTHLKTLHLGRNYLGVSGTENLRIIASALENLTHLKTLSLEGNYLGGSGSENLRIIASRLENLTHLKTLNLEGNYLGYASTESLRILASALENLTHLQTLSLEENDLGNASADNMRVLASGLEHLTHLKTLHLGWNCFCNASAENLRILASGLEHLTDLQTLNLKENCLSHAGAEGMRALAFGLKNLTHLQTLDLKYNRFGDAGADSMRALASALENLTHLKTLHLGRNYLARAGADSIRALAFGLKHLTYLQTLDLKYNRFGDAGADSMRILTSELEHLKHLKNLNLEGNNLNDTDVIDLQGRGYTITI